ncbi:caspase family protein [Reichenbachiella carrageenanivorans]|uniref:Caspase family protein n=1 Tax=Reichenbachiella carrageenanivorans TaxID=2979869 RepID=A0ABY6D1D4_9BACT|nr:caspase family protein [Reichenbachiella carrageenanivorans]UXX79972.1 caspase family protein [Reichenbachiella carrageenanivorans]
MKKLLALLALLHAVAISFAQDYPLETVVQRGHRAAVRTVAYTPDGKFLATGSRDNSIKLWQIATGREIRTFLGHLSSVNAIAFDPTGQWMASGSSDESIIIWNVATGQVKIKIKGHNNRVSSLAFNTDGTQLASGGWDRQAYVWDVATGEKITEVRADAATGVGVGVQVAFVGDNKKLITGNDDGRVIINDLASAQPEDTLRNIIPSSCGGCPSFIQLTDKSSELLTASRRGPVTLWNWKTGKIIKTYEKEADDYNAVGMKGNTVLVSDEDTVKLWTKSGQLIRKILIAETEINSATLSPDGKHVAVATNDRVTRIWNVQSGKQEQSFKGFLNDAADNGLGLDPESYWQFNISRYVGYREAIRVSPDEQLVAKARGASVQLWDMDKGRVVRSFDGHTHGVITFEFSKDGQYFFTASGDKTIKMWDVATGKELKNFKGHRELVFALALSQNGKYLASGSWDSSARLWDITSGKEIQTYRMEQNSPYALAFAQNDLYLMVGSLGKELKLIELDSGEPAKHMIGHTEIVADLKVRDGQALTASWDGRAKIWDVASGLSVQKFGRLGGQLYVASWSQGGAYVVTAGSDRVARIWDAQSGELIRTFEGHTDAILFAQFIHADKHLITHSLDGTTRIWEVATGKEIISHVLLNQNDWLVTNRNGYFDATEQAKQNIFFVRGMESYSLDQFFEDFYQPGILGKSLKPGGLLNENIKTMLKNSPPPRVEIISPTSGEHLTQNEIDVMVKITDEGGGLDEVKILHNGKRLPGQDRMAPVKPKPGKSVFHHYPVQLVPGKNVIAISAFSEGRIESELAQREIFAEGIHEDITCHVMAVGINKYKNPSLDLNYALEDAEAFLKLVKTKGKKLFNKTEVYSLFNEEATKANMLAMLDEIAAKARPQDVFFFYYAGHGSMVEGNFYFIPTENIRLYDFDLLTNEAIDAAVIQEKFANISALKQLVVLDACQSGGSTELLAVRGASEEKAMAQLSRSSGVHVLAASGSEQYATEFAELGHGLFTYVLLEALSGKADGAPKDGKVTIYELKAYIDSQVPEYSTQYKGKPQYPVTYSRGQDFPVVLE